MKPSRLLIQCAAHGLDETIPQGPLHALQEPLMESFARSCEMTDEDIAKLKSELPAAEKKAEMACLTFLGAMPLLLTFAK